MPWCNLKASFNADTPQYHSRGMNIEGSDSLSNIFNE